MEDKDLEHRAKPCKMCLKEPLCYEVIYDGEWHKMRQTGTGEHVPWVCVGVAAQLEL